MNRTFFKIFIILVLTAVFKNNFYSQNAVVCNNAQNLCTNSLFSFTAGIGTGLTPGLNVSNPFGNPQAVNAGCMFTNVANPQWLLLNITSSGNLGFSFGAFGSAFPQAGNYDWIMWPYSPSACTNIFNNTLPPVACNWNCTGAGGTGMGTVPFGGSPCNFQPSIPVVQGQQYIILITNPSGVNTNVSFANTGSAGVSCNPLLYPNLTACPGQLAVFTGTYVNASSGTYTLYPGAVVQGSPSFTVSSLVNQVYTVQAQGLNSSGAPIADQTTFTLTINPVIPISITTPTNFCYGSNATFTINPTGSGSFSVAGPASPTSTFATTSISIPNITTPNIGTFSVIANYTNGCTGTQTTVVNVAPNNSITVSTSSNACQGGTVNLTSSMPTATAYAWTGPGAYSSALQNPTINTIQPTSSGIYTVSSNINFNGIACPKTNTMLIDVVATNTVAITPNFTLCEGSNLNLTSNAVSAVSYSWTGPGTYTSALQNPTRNGILPADAGNYFVTALFTNGSITCTMGAVSNVSIVATSPVTVAVPNNICQNATANLTVTTSPLPLSYFWSGPNTFTSNLSNPSIVNIQTIASGIYSTTATYAIGSVSCTTTGTNQINVVGTNTVAVTPSFTLCEGSTLNLTSGAAPAVSYSWTGPGSYTSALQNPTQAALVPANAGNYSVTALFSNGTLTCTTGAVSNVSIVATSPVTVAVPNNICQNGTANLSATTSPLPLSYSWSGPNFFTSNIAAPFIANIQTNGSGIYTTTATYAIGTVSCITTGTNQINVVGTNTVAVTPNFTLCEGTNLNLTSSAVSAVSYSWNGPAVYTSAFQNPTINNIIPTSSGNYTATAFFTNGVLTCTTAAVSNVSVVPISTVSVIVPANICQNATANMTTSATGAIGFTWAGPNTFTSNIASPSIINIQPAASGVYTSTATFAIGTVSCTTTGTNQISVITTNTVSVAPTYTICEGSNLNLVSNATSAVSYSWNGPGAYTSALQNPTVAAILPAGAGNYSATAYFTNGILTCTTGAISNVSVVATPTINVTYPTNICQNATASFTAAAPGAISYSWLGPNGFNSNIATPNIPNIQTVGAGVYSTTALFSIGTLICSKTTTNQINVVGTNTVNVTTNFTVCEGANVNLTANAASAVSYSWNGPGAYTSAIQNATVIGVLPTGAGNYTGTAFFTNGILTCTTAAVSNVSVVATPVVNVVVPANICQSATAILSTSAVGAISYAWNGPNSFSSNLASTSIVNIQPNGAGVYTSTALFAIGSVSCTNTGTNQINVVTINSITVNSIMNGCALQTNVLQANSIGAVSYFWTGPSSYTAAVANATIYNTPVTASGIYTITTQYTNGFLTCNNTNTVNLIVNPVISFTLPTTQFACYNSVLTISGPVGATSYSWQNASGVIANTQNLVIPNVNLTMSGTYSLTAFIGFCATTQSIQVNVSSPIQYSLVPTNTTVCRGDSVKLKVGSVGGTANYAYVWNPASFLSSPTGSLQTATPFGTVIYNVYAYDIACPTYTIAHTFTINVKQPPLPDLRLDNAIGCEPFCAFYNSKFGTEAVSVSYDFGNNIDPIVADSFYYCLPIAGTYTLNILTLGTNGCAGKFRYLDPIVVHPSPKADFHYMPELPTVTSNQILFFPTAQNGPIVSRTWMFTGTGVSGYDSTSIEMYPQRTYTAVGKFPTMLISVTDQGCSDTVFKLVEVIDDIAIYIPNSFTPNGDGKNDIFIPKGVGFSTDDFIMELWASDGNQIYFTRDYSKGWDGSIKGKQAESSTYTYKIKVLGAHGEGYKEYVGHVNLIR
ncbi:MAG: gliding motility-associated C-terminal domain-containing protein [Bacteroidetes bacterium]|nr:gliding motility-associated C-terminal domain-containing protein [Bacteroidota bacterium]